MWVSSSPPSPAPSQQDPHVHLSSYAFLNAPLPLGIPISCGIVCSLLTHETLSTRLYILADFSKVKDIERSEHTAIRPAVPCPVLLCFIDPRVRKIRNEASSCPGIFSQTLRFYYVASSPSSPLLHLLDGHRKLVGCSTIPARSCPGPVQYPWGSIVKLKVPPDETPGLMTLHAHNTNVLQSIT